MKCQWDGWCSAVVLFINNSVSRQWTNIDKAGSWLIESKGLAFTYFHLWLISLNAVSLYWIVCDSLLQLLRVIFKGMVWQFGKIPYLLSCLELDDCLIGVDRGATCSKGSQVGIELIVLSLYMAQPARWATEALNMKLPLTDKLAWSS